ncbi:MAG: GNAT family N-acetyltransferase [Parcubacteria group bacterium]|nr:GNAT family N-acetyltransferase [Parcubacteria group bacterium]
MSIEFKRATTEDIPTLIFIEKSVAGTKIYSPMLDEKEWAEEIEKSVVYLVLKDNIVVGNVSYEIKDSDYVYISGFAIDSRFQKQGIGREVLTRLLEEFKDKKRIDLVTHPDNEAALKLYKSFGFVVESRKENYFGDGEPRLVLVLEK